MLDEMRSAWVEACLLFDERRAESQLSQAFALHPPEVVCSELLVKGIAEIGSRWYAGAASVQQEHFATSLAMRRLYTLAGSSPAPTRPGRILAACPAGEEHEFGLLFFTVLLRRRGWDVVYLGASVPLLRLESALQAAAPFLVLSVALTLPAAAALQEMGYLLKKSGLLLAYGGGIFNQLPALQHTIPGFLLGNDFSQASQLIEELWSHKPPVIEPLPPSPEHREALQHYHENASQIEADVQDALREDSIHPHHLEVANSALRQHLTAALSLGDIRLLTASITWVEGLLINHGLPRELILHYLNTYLQAIHRRLPQSDQPVFAPLVHLTWSMP
jgi:methanogenic corrinoid protein MtbC1